MKNDGGSIPTRRDLVKEEPGELTTAQLFEAQQLNGDDAWKLCAFTGKQLKDRIVSDYKGRLYNKESLLEYLLSPESYTHVEKEPVRHIKSMKDFVELQITTDERNDDKWVCPISKKESGKFVYIVECGHVFSESAMKNIDDLTNCMVCDTCFDQSNVITINPADEADMERLKSRINSLKENELTHSLKKASSKKASKKRKSETKQRGQTKAQKVK